MEMRVTRPPDMPSCEGAESPNSVGNQICLRNLSNPEDSWADRPKDASSIAAAVAKSLCFISTLEYSPQDSKNLLKIAFCSVSLRESCCLLSPQMSIRYFFGATCPPPKKKNVRVTPSWNLFEFARCGVPMVFYSTGNTLLPLTFSFDAPPRCESASALSM